MKSYIIEESDKKIGNVQEVSEESQQVNKPLTKEDIRTIILEEKRLGLSPRCEWCPDNIFCSAYLDYVKKDPNEIVRCENLFSGR